MAAFTEKGAPYPFELTRDAVKQLGAIPEREAKRIAQAIVNACQAGTGDVLPLKGSPGEYRLRVGHYRVLFRVVERRQLEKRRQGQKTVEVESVIATVQVLTILRRTGNTYR